MPTQLKIARGTLRNDRINGKEPKPIELITLPSAPDYLSDRALEIYQDLGENLISQRLLSVMDLSALVMLSVDLSLYEDCLRKILEQGSVIVVNTREGQIPKINPYHNVKKVLEDKIIKLLSEFGLTPSSRSRVSQLPKPKGNLKSLIDSLKD